MGVPPLINEVQTFLMDFKTLKPSCLLGSLEIRSLGHAHLPFFRPCSYEIYPQANE